MYGRRKPIASHFGKARLGLGRNSFPFWLCAFLAFSATVVLSGSGYDEFPWVDGAGYTIFKTGRPQRYYTEGEILSEWQPYLPASMPPPSSVSDVYTWLENNGYYSQITPPTVCAITNTERVVDFGEVYVDATNSLVSVAVAPSIGDSPLGSTAVHLFPAYYSSRYGLGFIGPDGRDYFGASPAFGGNFSWGSPDFGIFTTNLFTVDPWKFSDYQDGLPIVFPSQFLNGGSFRRARAFFKGRLRVMNVYYCFPVLPTMGRFESSSGFPVTRTAAFSMLDEFWLPWYWQTSLGVVLWSAEDTMVLRNVLRFHSSSTNQLGDI